MDVFLLGAGKPAVGDRPSALKNIAPNTTAMDWQINSFELIADHHDIHYLGGYHVDEVIKNYPKLNFTVIPDWEMRSVLYTLLKAPFTGRSIIVSYSDTVFRKEVISDVLLVDAEIVFCVDSNWKKRYESRSTDDIQSAETIEVEGPNGGLNVVEFTGLIHFKNDAVKYLSELDEIDVGSSLIDLINYFQGVGLSVKSFDVASHWAELNSPDDIAHFILGTKAETLSRLEPLVRQSHIGKQISFTTAHWINDSDTILDEISTCFSDTNLIVRSSSKSEDGWYLSNAGGFESLLNVNGGDRPTVRKSIEITLASYGENPNEKDQILVQECLQKVRVSGVIFTCSLETGAPYYHFNFDDKTQSTESVTSGSHGDLRTVVVSRLKPECLNNIAPEIMPVLHAVHELERLLGFDKLDIEFAIDENGLVHIFQVRPITVDHSKYEMDLTSIDKSLKDCALHFHAQQSLMPFVYGDKAIFANMPDWNPAEIIGTRPKPLSFSLYRYLITNDVWAQQRFEFGYRDVRPSPLILSFSGQPYVDVRASLNSFIPAALPDELAERLATAYIDILATNPSYHDKIEFDVAFTVWTPDFYKNAIDRLTPYGLSAEDIAKLEVTLKDITCNALSRLGKDIAPIGRLRQRKNSIVSSNIPVIDKIFLLLDDCKRFGTLSFSHAARAGFVATTLLKSFVTSKILSEERRLEFMRSIKTVAGEFEESKYSHKLGRISIQDLVENYGHLRPGTYDICAQAYWEDPEKYFLTSGENKPEFVSPFTFSLNESENVKIMLDNLGAKETPNELLQYLQEAIEARELVKFQFTKNLSKALDMCACLAEKLSLTREQISFLEYHDLEQLKLNVIGVNELKDKISQNQKTYTVSQVIEMPGFIKQESDFYCFERHTLQPNFITRNKIHATVILLSDSEPETLAGAVVLIPQADPGFDWLFGCNIGGLITQFGGANSHMAIRAAENDLPAAIGVGDKLYEQIARMRKIELDCNNQIIREIK
jgi:glutamine kinase